MGSSFMTRRTLQVYEDLLRELEQISQETERIARQWLNAQNLGFEREKRALENEARNLLKDLTSIKERMERFLSHVRPDTDGESAEERGSC